MTGQKFTANDVAKRVRYTDRDGRVKYGAIRDVADGSKFVDVDLDDSKRTRFYVPEDTVDILTDEEIELLSQLGE